jgi:hypothetical protein
VTELVAVAAAGMEEEAVMGWTEPRAQLRIALERASAPEVDDSFGLGLGADPFGPDPARLASIGRGEDAPYYSPPTAMPSVTDDDPGLPKPVPDASGR